MKKILTLIIILFGCGQSNLGPEYSFKATFLDAFTDQPIEGFQIARLSVIYPASVSLTGNARATLVNNIPYSNKDGVISIAFHKFKKASKYEFLFYSRDNKYFTPVNENIDATEFDSKQNIIKTYKLDSKAQLRVKVNLKTPLKDGDKIRLVVGYGYEGIITNKYVNDDKIYVERGNVPTDVLKIYTIGGVETRVQEKITLKPFVVNDYEFTY